MTAKNQVPLPKPGPHSGSWELGAVMEEEGWEGWGSACENLELLEFVLKLQRLFPLSGAQS